MLSRTLFFKLLAAQTAYNATYIADLCRRIPMDIEIAKKVIILPLLLCYIRLCDHDCDKLVEKSKITFTLSLARRSASTSRSGPSTG